MGRLKGGKGELANFNKSGLGGSWGQVYADTSVQI